MAETTIEWAHYTFNPWRGCTKVSAGCLNCYAEKMSHRNPKVLGIWGPRGQRAIAAESYWNQLPHWHHDAQEAGERRRVFCASLADVGEGPETMPAEAREAVQNARQRLSEAILRYSDALDFLLLTKRPEYMTSLYPAEVLSRCWVGTSVEDQKAADARIPKLLDIPAAVRFLSCEPLLGPVEFNTVANLSNGNWTKAQQVELWGKRLLGTSGIYWVIVGGESGPGARPMHPEWARSLRDQCVAAEVPFLFKQWGEWFPRDQWEHNPDLVLPDDCDGFTENSRTHLFESLEADGVCPVHKVGKAKAGRQLDGVTWDQLPPQALQIAL